MSKYVGHRLDTEEVETLRFVFWHSQPLVTVNSKGEKGNQYPADSLQLVATDINDSHTATAQLVAFWSPSLIPSIQEITDAGEIGLSDYIRVAIQEKLDSKTINTKNNHLQLVSGS